MMRVVLIRPGATDFDEQGRIKGSLDIPMNRNGKHQVARAVDALHDLKIDIVYTAPCQSADQTARTLARDHDVKVKQIDLLQNLDHGLWQGKLIAEMRQKQPKVYRRWQDQPETVCPPQGETLESAKQRVRTVFKKLLKKHKNGVVALVVPEPMASLIHCFLEARDIDDIWKAECDRGNWELVEVQPELLSVEN